MTIASGIKRGLKYLFIPGMALAIAGTVAGLITQVWSPLYVGLIVAGVVLLAVWLIFILTTAQGFWQRRSLQISTNALVATVALITILGLLNFLAVRYSYRADLTENQLLTLSAQSQKLVTDLKQPLKVVVFDKEPSQVDKTLLENYRRYSNNFSFEFIDPDLQPGKVEQFKVKSPGEVFIEYSDKKQLVQSLINYQQKDFISEAQLTNAIEKIQRDRIQTLYFLQGHGEYPLNSSNPSQESGISLAVNNLREKGYKIEPLNLVRRSAIPEDASVIIIAGAKQKLFEQEVKALKDYCDRGGSLFLAIDPNTDLGLESLLKEWGIQLDERVIIDASGKGNMLGYGPATPIITNYGDHPISRDFNNEYSLYPLARPLGTVKVSGVTAVALLITDNQMWAESDLQSDEVVFNDKKDVLGPFDLGLALTRNLAEKRSTTPSNKPQQKTKSISSPTSKTPQQKQNSAKTTQTNTNTNQPKKTESRLVAIGNSSFATDSLFEDPRVLNGDIFLNSIQWLASEDEQNLSIRPKQPKNRRINLSPLQSGILGWMSSVIFPLLGLIIAGITWWRRR
jgi:ABC-type uncharacterized transport system involved in gliding motility auxiliary subunit